MDDGWQTGPNNAITDVPGIRVGHVTDRRGKTGCTVVLCESARFAAVDARGGAPGTRETDVLSPANVVRTCHAVVFSGGSAFGLAAADGVMRWCEEQGRGMETPGGRVPIVPAAVIYDLGITANQRRPGADEGYAACATAAETGHEVGSVGAGTGATVGKLNGRTGWCKGGLGAASATLLDGAVVAVLAVVNAFGDTPALRP